MLLEGAVALLYLMFGYFVTFSYDPVINLRLQLNLVTNESKDLVIPSVKIIVTDGNSIRNVIPHFANNYIKVEAQLFFQAAKSFMTNFNYYRNFHSVFKSNNYSLIHYNPSPIELIEKIKKKFISKPQPIVKVESNNDGNEDIASLNTNIKDSLINYNVLAISIENVSTTIDSDTFNEFLNNKSEYFVRYSDILSSEFLNGVILYSDNYPTSKNALLRAKTNRKSDNELNLIKPSYTHDECSLNSFKGPNFIKQIASFQLTKEDISNVISNPLYRKLENDMAFYYDVSMSDYSLNDLINFILITLSPGRCLYYIIGILILICWRLYSYYRPFCKSELYKESPMLELRSIGTITKPPLLSKVELMKCVLEMKNIQNDSLVKMENVISKTNIKLQYLLEKLVLIEDIIILKGRDTQNNELLNFQDSLNKDLYGQICQLSLKHKEGTNDLCSLSSTLKQTKDNMDELQFNMQQLLASQKIIKNDIEKLNEHCTYDKSVYMDGISSQFEFIKYPEQTYNDVSMKINRSSSETMIGERRGSSYKLFNCNGETSDSELQKLSHYTVLPISKSADAAWDKTMRDNKFLQIGCGAISKTDAFAQNDDKLSAHINEVEKCIKNGTAVYDFTNIVGTGSSGVVTYTKRPKYNSAITQEILVRNPLFQKQMVQNNKINS